MKSRPTTRYTGGNVDPTDNQYFEFAQQISEVITYENNVGEFTFATLTPSLPTGDKLENQLPTPSNGNQLNKEDDLGLQDYKLSNYLVLTVPRHLFTIKEIQILPDPFICSDGQSTHFTTKIIYYEFLKGQKFVITNRQEPVILGVIEQR